jgi:hypothetical protein
MFHVLAAICKPRAVLPIVVMSRRCSDAEYATASTAHVLPPLALSCVSYTAVLPLPLLLVSACSSS